MLVVPIVEYPQATADGEFPQVILNGVDDIPLVAVPVPALFLAATLK